jgi:hypothetical protein
MPLRSIQYCKARAFLQQYAGQRAIEVDLGELGHPFRISPANHAPHEAVPAVGDLGLQVCRTRRRL